MRISSSHVLLFAACLQSSQAQRLQASATHAPPPTSFPAAEKLTAADPDRDPPPEGKNVLRDGSDVPIPDNGICPSGGGDGRRGLQRSTVPGTTNPTGQGWSGKDICTVWAPGEVVNYRVECDGATYLDFRIADCCVAEDHWQLRGKNWDSAPQTAVTTSPGPRSAYGVPARVYNYGGTPYRLGHISALIECSYLHGVDLFGASSYVYFESDATGCTIEKVAVDARIDRSP